MGIIVNSPYSGKAVKVRDNDAGRSVKDEEGRVFFVLKKSDGSGYYGSVTRAGNPKEEARALEMEEKMGTGKAVVHENVANMSGGKKGGGFGKLVAVVIVIAVLAGAGWAVTMGPLAGKIPGIPNLSGTSTPAPAPTTP